MAANDEGVLRMLEHLDALDRVRSRYPGCGYSLRRALDPQNARCNRYSNVLPYDHALLPGAYLNASRIPPAPAARTAFVASQAPLPHTMGEFLDAVRAEGVALVVQLTPLAEHGRAKASQYWPNNVGETLDLYHGTHAVTLIDASPYAVPHSQAAAADNDKMWRRTLRATEKATGRTWDFVQLHVTTWPDHSALSAAYLAGLVDLVGRERPAGSDPMKPVWTHCSAGIGRTGTLMAAIWIREASAPRPWDMAVACVEHMRRYRPGMVQTAEQLQSLIEYFAMVGS